MALEYSRIRGPVFFHQLFIIYLTTKRLMRHDIALWYVSISS